MKKILLTLFLFFSTLYNLLAQVPPPPDYHENATPGAPSLPVDQYVIFLIAAALIVGIYAIWHKKTAVNQI